MVGLRGCEFRGIAGSLCGEAQWWQSHPFCGLDFVRFGEAGDIAFPQLGLLPII